MGLEWDLDWDPTGLFDSASIIPNGDNYYQYSNPAFDAVLESYTQSFLMGERIQHLQYLQQTLYEDLPAISILYPRAVYLISDEVSGLDITLWDSSSQSIDKWSNGVDTELRYAECRGFDIIHPLLIEDTRYSHDNRLLGQIYNGLLYRENGTRTWGPRIASSYFTSDGITWTVNIDLNAKWTDGTPVTSEDVIFSYQSIMNPAVGSPSYSHIIKYFDNSSITKINDTTVQFVLKEPYAVEESLLAYPLIPKHIWLPTSEGGTGPEYEDWGIVSADWMQNDPSKIFGCGPYKVVEWDSTSEIIHLEKNDYFNNLTNFNEPILEDIYFELGHDWESAYSAFVDGIIDMLDSDFFLSSWPNDNIPNSYLQFAAVPVVRELSINMQHPYLGTGEVCPLAGTTSAKHIRKAISHMIPREVFVEEFFEKFGVGPNIPAVSPMPDACTGFNTSLEPYDYSINLAKDEMRAAGFEYSEGGSVETSIALPTVLAILALAGGCHILKVQRRRK
ncbi:MAG: ABC transporter substrate-binding protein [Promethearchaeota archaeon]